MARIEYWFEQDLKKPVQVQAIHGNVFSLDNNGTLVGVKVYSDGEAVTLGGSVTGYCILADGTTVSVSGTRSGNQAYITMPQSALAVPGPIRILLKLTESSVITTLGAFVSTVYRTRTDTVITPSQQIITDWSQQISAEMQAVEDASAAQDAKISELKSAFDNESVRGCSLGSITDITWQNGRIGDQGGIISGTNAPNYCISSVLKNSSDVKRIDCSIKTGWEFYITEHTSSSMGTGTYVRHYPKDKTPTQGAVRIYPTKGHRYTVNIKKTDGSNFTPSQVPTDVITISIWNPTDKTLTLSDAAADAKTVGDFKKMAFLSDYTDITRIMSGDLDDYTTPGTYSIPANVYIQDIENMPVDAVGMLYVIKMASAAIYQMYLAYTSDGGSIYIRNKSSSSWRGWVKLSAGDQKSRFSGKKVSIIGDSIETYAGYVVSGYRTSYPSLGVNSVDQTWWMQVINNTGAMLEVNAAFTGSMVTNVRQGDEHADHYPDLYERVSVIGSPDIIFVTLGTNDSNYNVDLGEYDFETAYANLDESKFRTAYIKGIKALQATYSDAEIICVTEYMKEAYRESVEHIAKELGVEYINAYDYNRQSGSHPGNLGMQQIASLVLFPTDAFLWQKHYPADAQATGLKISALEGKVPDAPVSNGSYVLKATVNNGVTSYYWGTLA